MYVCVCACVMSNISALIFFTLKAFQYVCFVQAFRPHHSGPFRSFLVILIPESTQTHTITISTNGPM